MENILNKEPVLRVQKKLDEYNKDLKAIVLNSSANVTVSNTFSNERTDNNWMQGRDIRVT